MVSESSWILKKDPTKREVKRKGYRQRTVLKEKEFSFVVENLLFVVLLNLYKSNVRRVKT